MTLWALRPFFVYGDRQTLRNHALQELLQPVVAGLGYELLGIEYLPGRADGLLRLYIDHPEGICIEDCEQVSHQVSGVLEVEDPIRGKYVLEVSSPGLERPLFALEHFQRFIGQQVKIRLQRPLLLEAGNTRKNFSGLLTGVENQDILIEVDQVIYRLSYEHIDKAHLVPSDE